MNSEKVKNLNSNLKKNLKNTKELKNISLLCQVKENVKKKINQNQCDKCFLQFNDYFSLQQHKWKKHPSDNYQYNHSQITDWSNYSLAYKDDPYY